MLNNTEFKVINAYYGSSSYNSRQMSRLINSLVQDCREIGIRTEPDGKIRKLIEEWENRC